MKMNFEKLKNNTGLDFKGEHKKENLIFYMQSILYNLKTHNKNYTKEQEDRINLIYDIFECIEQ